MTVACGRVRGRRSNNHGEGHDPKPDHVSRGLLRPSAVPSAQTGVEREHKVVDWGERAGQL